jgi:phage repressor protein C with HTH and peptisase S24 domain
MQIAVDKRVLDNTNMPNDANSPMYDALLALKPAELSLNAWTVKAGVGRSMFTEIRRHGNPTSETLQKLLDAIGVSLSDLYSRMADGNTLVRTEVKGTGMAAHDVDRAWHGAQPVKPVPLLGSAFGGEWSDGVEMTELHLADVLDYLSRPAAVAGDREAYVVEIVGDSMYPRFKPGERAVVSPRMPVRIGDDVIVQLTGARPSAAPGEETVPDYEFANRITMVLIKEVAKRTPRTITLRQFNPDMTFDVPLERVAAVHRVATRL